MQLISKALNSGYLFSQMLLFLIFIAFTFRFAIIVHHSYQEHSLSLTAKEIILFLQSIRERAITQGSKITVLIDSNLSLFRSEKRYLRLPHYIKIKCEDYTPDTTFADYEIKFFPDGHISAGTFYLKNNNVIIKLTISVHQMPIFSLYSYKNNSWSKILI